MHVKATILGAYSHLTKPEGIDLPEGSTIDDLVRTLCERVPSLGEKFFSSLREEFEGKTLIVLNDKLAGLTDRLHDGDHVKFFSPVSGGGL